MSKLKKYATKDSFIEIDEKIFFTVEIEGYTFFLDITREFDIATPVDMINYLDTVVAVWEKTVKKGFIGRF